MPDYIPKLPEYNDNAPPYSPLKETLQLLLGVALLMGLIYLTAAHITQFVILRIPPSYEYRLFHAVWPTSHYHEQALPPELTRVIAKIKKADPTMPYISVYLIKHDAFNAVAVPGFNILVFSGMSDIFNNENMMTFVIAHEIGHHVKQDPLRAMGRQLLAAGMLAVLGIQDKGDLLGNMINNRYSQEQEIAADNYGVAILMKLTGSPQGAKDFFTYLETKQHRNKFLSYFDTHPHNDIRINNIEKQARLITAAMGRHP